MEREPSYYEVALTNRQVVVGFVILLACIFAAFLSGVWIGRDATPVTRAQIAQASAAAPETEAKLEKLTFFGEPDGAGTAGAEQPAADAPQPSPPVAQAAPPSAAEIESDKLRQTLEAEMTAHREEAPAPAATAPAPGTRVRRPTGDLAEEARVAPPESAAATPPAEVAVPTAAATTAAPVASAPEPYWIQVYSSTNGARAREIAGNLRRSRFEVRVLESAIGGGVTYRVRVGPYRGKGEADRAAQRLRREFRLDTWVTDQL